MTEKKSNKKQFIGLVVSDKMDKSRVVQVERLVKHELYKKYLKRRSKFMAHDSENVSKNGDKVLIVETRPLSKLKRFRISKLIK